MVTHAWRPSRCSVFSPFFIWNLVALPASISLGFFSILITKLQMRQGEPNLLNNRAYDSVRLCRCILSKCVTQSHVLLMSSYLMGWRQNKLKYIVFVVLFSWHRLLPLTQQILVEKWTNELSNHKKRRREIPLSSRVLINKFPKLIENFIWLTLSRYWLGMLFVTALVCMIAD